MLVPVGGGDPGTWPDRLRPLGHPELHLYDREQFPETEARQRAIAKVNARSHCRGYLTSKRSLENYLHPQALGAAGGGQITFGDHDPVGLMLAQFWYQQLAVATPWESLERRTHRRLAARAKRWLNTVAIEQMTAELLAERDPAGEVLSWLQAIEELVHRSYAEIA